MTKSPSQTASNSSSKPGRALTLMLAIAGWFTCGVTVKAVLFYDTPDPDHNTTPPTGLLSGSGWQWQGRWGSYLGTPVGPRHFITVSHVGGTVGQVFVLNGVSYTTLAFQDHAESDLRVVQICGRFPDFAAPYTNRNEVVQPLVVFGRGTQRGIDVITSGPLGIRSHGWRWGAADGRLRWGENVVEAVVPGDDLFNKKVGELLWIAFDAVGVFNESHLSVGDSGGGVFLSEDGVWKLAGLNYAVDGPYRLDSEGMGFEAAIYDEGGLHKEEGELWRLVPPLPQTQPGGFYAVRISSHVAWIESVLSEPPIADLVPVIQSAISPAGPYEDEWEAVTDSELRTITLATPLETRFYRLRACDTLRVTRVKIEEAALVLVYESIVLN